MYIRAYWFAEARVVVTVLRGSCCLVLSYLVSVHIIISLMSCHAAHAALRSASAAACSATCAASCFSATAAFNSATTVRAFSTAV